MKRKNKLGIIGLKFYARRMEKELRDYNPEIPAKSFDTYTSFIGKLKYFLSTPRLDAIFSINGDNRKSRAFSWAKKNNVPLVMNWSGTDVLTCIENYKRGEVDQDLVNYAKHTCQCEWIKGELSLIGIEARILQFQYYKLKPAVNPKGKLKVLSRIHQDSPDFYGMSELIVLAGLFPEISFSAVGISSIDREIPENLKLISWVDDMEAVYDDHMISLRFPLHDGLSPFVLESLARGKHVLYRFPVEGARHTPDLQSMTDVLRELEAAFNSGTLGPNLKGQEYIEREFNEKKVFDSLLDFIHD